MNCGGTIGMAGVERTQNGTAFRAPGEGIVIFPARLRQGFTHFCERFRRTAVNGFIAGYTHRHAIYMEHGLRAIIWTNGIAIRRMQTSSCKSYQLTKSDDRNHHNLTSG